ncbi:RiPP maturation radical SAM C-methyltransferase [Rhizobium leguminosarum]|uniref:Uncharacterized protein n=1 Tax=Rhizobium leguminosarum TaxID=384 RepID=A0A1B1CHR8_RHILE|nr:RiPP maturation radical SAM C-methyltransferase [Rhizobium leguminosarum]ANP89307.1 hypothetical protein BA011_26420 [Rhizobium leguminosarum]
MKAQRCVPASSRVLLVHMPMADPIMPNLGIEILASRLRADGLACDTFYGSLLLPPVCSNELLHGMAGYMMFSPFYFNLDIDRFVGEGAAIIARTGSGPYQATLQSVAEELHAGIAAAEFCLERSLEKIPVGTYDVVGFSVIFDTQKIPSLALARALKEREPSLKFIFGGTGCDGEMASAILEHFPEPDAVVRGDAEHTIVATIRALRDGTMDVHNFPANVELRDNGRREPRADGKVASLRDRTVPEYESFIAQRFASPYRERQFTLLFEASRGCWWGDKHHCRFCGIRTVREGYREREPDAVFDEILALHRAHRPHLLYATDAILSYEHIRSLLPKLARHRRTSGEDIKLFFEIKSTVGRREAALLAAANVVAVQPGIESFSTAMLRNADKGATGIRQIAALKWLCAFSIDTIYGLLVGSPGETSDDVRAMIDVIGALHHLQPPLGVNPLALHRFSPYWDAPGRWGISNIRPYDLQRLAFQVPDAALSRICYELNYDSEQRLDPLLTNCLVPAFDGALFSLEWREALWARFYTGAPQRQRQSVEQYKIVKRA